MLVDGFDENGTLTAAYISQVGDVPANARSIMFSTDHVYTGDRFVVSLNGTAIPIQLYSTGSTVNSSFGPVQTYIGDISAFAGETNVDLRFTKLVQDPSKPFNHGAVDLDSIAFSSIIIPEPSSLVLFAIGAITACACLFRRRAVGRR